MNTAIVYNTQNQLLISNGLVGYWSFHEGSGSIARDFSSTRNNGTINYSPPTWGIGKVGSALSFDGTSQYVSMAGTNLSGLSTSDWSISLWLNQRGLNLYSGIVVFNNEGLVNSKSNALALIHNGNAIATSVAITSYVNQWIHVVGTNIGSVYTIYINGVNALAGFQSDSGYGLNGVYWIGNGYVGTKINGLVNDVRVYNRGLSATEISVLYNT